MDLFKIIERGKPTTNSRWACRSMLKDPTLPTDKCALVTERVQLSATQRLRAKQHVLPK